MLFGLNRFDMRSPLDFAASVERGEALGFDCAFIPSSPLLVPDPYVNLALAAVRTERIRLGPLLETPVIRHPAVLAGSIATIERLAPGRTLLGLGVGDTAVRTVDRAPARVDRLAADTRTIIRLLAGESLDPARPDGHRLRHHARAEVWICAGGPRTLRMAGATADGVFIRVGTHEANIRASVEAIRAGAEEAGRDPDALKLGAIFHTVLNDDPEVAGLIGRSAAAGYYEYTPVLLERTGVAWNGPDVEVLKEKIWQDFHHTPDLVAAGRLVDFLPDGAVDAFCLHGTPERIVEQLRGVLQIGVRFDIVVTHPMAPPEVPVHAFNAAFMERVAQAVIPAFR